MNENSNCINIKNGIKFSNGDDDDKIIFNIKRLFENTLNTSNRREIYKWAVLEGFKAESNGDIRIDETLRLVRKF